MNHSGFPARSSVRITHVGKGLFHLTHFCLHAMLQQAVRSDFLVLDAGMEEQHARTKAIVAKTNGGVGDPAAQEGG